MILFYWLSAVAVISFLIHSNVLLAIVYFGPFWLAAVVNIFIVLLCFLLQSWSSYQRVTKWTLSEIIGHVCESFWLYVCPSVRLSVFIWECNLNESEMWLYMVMYFVLFVQIEHWIYWRGFNKYWQGIKFRTNLKKLRIIL